MASGRWRGQLAAAALLPGMAATCCCCFCLAWQLTQALCILHASAHPLFPTSLPNHPLDDVLRIKVALRLLPKVGLNLLGRRVAGPKVLRAGACVVAAHLCGAARGVGVWGGVV